ncbi:hypothetical protein SAMD00019534_011250 [Acytostelium subglobosum LB1]|uniref:hypothetical protein n=1 Tax=Acytostelium subglobosum LB1 TaxID=1410327 RepID=UPI000644F03C|nr:hypothetical protein SAMD00019534_011250 [Acytostelium subglobosum LB1]GAM17950.1 hypothetical protein SAMD00019534_011250 [Acytostelium subglobosum LB1]|eukprot:XP_012758546.1 hypothetical protein SAMD00019534_011250 [Acytostelium subglobosum LB1]
MDTLEKYVPAVVLKSCEQAYNHIDRILAPYNLPIPTEFVVLALVGLLSAIIISAIFGGSSDSRGSSGSSTSSSSSSAGGKKKGNSLVLLGLCDSGKTTLFLKLIQKSLTSYSSISVNKGNFNNAGKKLPIIDIPGHAKMRPTLPQYLSQASSIIYLIDSTTFFDQSIEEAQNLYDILVDPSVYERRVPILIFCNKTDLTTIGESDVQSILERELDELRKTRGSAPSMAGNEDAGVEREIYLGNEGTSFQFDHLPNEVTFAQGSVKSEETEAPEPIMSFIQPR